MHGRHARSRDQLDQRTECERLKLKAVGAQFYVIGSGFWRRSQGPISERPFPESTGRSI